jgi:hypothetical protein
MPSPRFRAVFPLACLLLLTAGCNYIHFGRLDRIAGARDTALAGENSDLRTERKMLQQELAIAHKENEALRVAIDVRSAPSSSELARKLEDATRELATLRANYARLQSERDRLQAGSGRGDSAATIAALEQVADLKTKLGDTEDKLAAALRNFTELQDENARLRREINQTRGENAKLAASLTQATARAEQSESAFAQLNTDLLAEKDARARAEQIAVSLRNQLQIVTAQGAAAPSSPLAAARQTTADLAQAIAPSATPARPAGDAAPTASLSTSAEKLRPTPPPAAKPARTYVVKDGDTLETIAAALYGRPERWTVLYAANNALLSGGRALKPGMTLDVPEE